MAREIRQTRPFSSPARQLAVTLMRTGEVMRHAVESALRPRGVSPEQYNVLRILRGAEAPGVPCLEIAQRMIARSPNITRMMDKMVAKGLARRQRVEGDRRVVLISITADGRRLLGDLDGAVEAVLGRLSSMKPAQLAELVALLDEVRERLATPTARESAGRKRVQAVSTAEEEA
ncbi:MAG TPA: MarR family transcriptional regulator [Vicinamibacteria bacterium]|nr:MarR family transcriptional regulator [Vicinamibacteria bacterium]